MDTRFRGNNLVMGRARLTKWIKIMMEQRLEVLEAVASNTVTAADAVRDFHALPATRPLTFTIVWLVHDLQGTALTTRKRS